MHAAEGVERVELGATVEECRRAIPWPEENAIRFLTTYPFDQKFPFVTVEKAVVWTNEKKESDGWPTHIIGVFADVEKTRLLDLIEIRNGQRRPLVAGVYQQNLLAIRKGMLVEDMYRLVGKDDCEYYLGEGQQWCVRFVFAGYRGTLFVIEAEAQSGKVFAASERSI